MKKLATILVTVLAMAVLATPVFAFDTGLDRRGHGRIRQVEQRGHAHGRPVYYQTYNHHVPSRNPGVVVNLPLVPLPGVSHMFQSINIRLY